MNGRLRLMAAALTLGALVWGLVLGERVSANPLTGLQVDTQCDAVSHRVTILTADITSPHSVRLVGQVLVGQSFTDVGSPIDVVIPTGATSTVAMLAIPLGGASAYRVRVVSSDLDNAAGVVSNVVQCTAATSTSTPTPTSPPTATPTATPT